MDHYHTTLIDASFKVRYQSIQPLYTREEEEKIERCWEQALRANPPSHRLFNGQLLCCDFYDAKELKGSFIEYKYYYAQRRLPHGAFTHYKCPVAVTGISRSEDAFLIARRADWVTTDPLKLELAPAGTLSADYLIAEGEVDFKRQLLAELEEETGIPSALVSHLKPLAIFHDLKRPVIDIALEIVLPSHLRHDILQLSDEYLNYFWLQKQEIPTFFKENSEELSSLSRKILSMLVN